MTRRRIGVLLGTAGISVVALVVWISVGGVVVLGAAAALCKYELNCHIRSNGNLTDAQLLDRLQKESVNSPHGTYPKGFQEQVVARGFTFPTDFAFLPNGDALVAQKDGQVFETAVPGTRSVRVLDLRSRIETFDYRGLVTVAVSPTFARDRRIYVLYVVKRAAAPKGTTVMRLSSFVLPRHGEARHEHVLLGSVTAPTCSTLPSTADCLPSDLDHNGGEIAFAPDGTLYVATGDGGGHDDEFETTAARAQDLDSLSGKVLRITPTGEGVRTNPFWNGNPHANRSKVWAYGFRNPFRITVGPGGSVPLVGDVGRFAFEELDAVVRGGNFGWPCLESGLHNPVYAKTATCKAIYAKPPANLRGPDVAIKHPVSNSIVGGAYAPKTFPAPLRGAFVFGDWVRGWLMDVRIAPSGARLGPATQFATHLPGPVAIHVGPGGALYYLGLNSGDLRRVVYKP